MGAYKRYLCMLALLAAATACNDDEPEAEHHSHRNTVTETASAASQEELAQKAEDERRAKADKDFEELKIRAEAEQAAEEARQKAAEVANPHFDIVMQVIGLQSETVIYAYLTESETKLKWSQVSTELESGHHFFSVSDPTDLVANIMVRPDQIQYITINKASHQQ